VPPELERVHELERTRRIDIRVVPLEPEVEVHVVGVRLQVELLDVVDQRAHAHLGGLGSRGRGTREKAEHDPERDHVPPPHGRRA